MSVAKFLKILAVAAIAGTSVGAVGVPMKFLPAAIEGARVDGDETAANTIREERPTAEAFVRTLSPDHRACALMKGGKLAAPVSKLRAPECAFPVLF